MLGTAWTEGQYNVTVKEWVIKLTLIRVQTEI